MIHTKNIMRTMNPQITKTANGIQAVWKINCLPCGVMKEFDSQKEYWDNPSRDAKLKYYAGFSYPKKIKREKEMFKEELEDLEKMYIEKLKIAQSEMEYINPSLVHYMKEFIQHYEEEQKIKIKLESLQHKKNVSTQESCQDCE